MRALANPGTAGAGWADERDLRSRVAADPPVELGLVGPLVAEVHRCRRGSWAPPVRLRATDDLLDRVGGMTGLAHHVAPIGSPIVVAIGGLRAAMSAADPGEATDVLRGFGVTADDAAAVAPALTSGDRFAVRLLVRAGPRRHEGTEVAWAVGPTGYWRLPILVTPLADGYIRPGVRTRNLSVVVRPVAAEDLLHELAGA